MLESIQLKNFKSNSDLEVSLSGLTLLSGLNGSGKSSILQSLALLRQGSRSDGGSRLICPLNGPLVSLGRAEDVRFEGAKDSSVGLELSYEDSELDFVAKPEDGDDVLSFQVKGTVEKLTELLQGPFQYVQADRLVPASRYDLAGRKEQADGWLGSHGQFAVDYLARQEDQGVSSVRRYERFVDVTERAGGEFFPPTTRLIDQVTGWLQFISPGVLPSARVVDDTDAASLRFSYRSGVDVGSSRPHRASNVGFGLTYSLPIVTALLGASSGALVLLENPEAHLHPRGQSALGHLIALAAADGVQVIVETHSDHILNGLRLAVRREFVEPDTVTLHYFQRSALSGTTEVSTPIVNASGRLSFWPDGFFDEWTRALDNLV